MLNLKSPNRISLYNGELNFDFSIKEGECIALVGSNGIGKSSFFHYLKSHRIDFFKDISVGFLDQFSLNPLGDLRGVDLFNMLNDLYPNRCLYSQLDNFRLIDDFQFRDKISTPIKSLSGGENQILKILALFYIETGIYFLDEPTNHLDTTRVNILKELLSRCLNNGKSIVLINHNYHFSHDLCHSFLPMIKSGLNIKLEDKISTDRVDLEKFNQWIIES